MLSPQLRNKVHNLWTMFWSAGMTNPLVAIEQITYLLFLRQLERLDDERTGRSKAQPIANPKPSIYYDEERQKCRWSYISKDPTFQLLNDTVFPWLRGLERWLSKNSVSTAFTASDFKDAGSLLQTIAKHDTSLSRTVADKLPQRTRDRLWPQPPKLISEEFRTALVEDFNTVLKGDSLYHPQRFEHVALRKETAELIQEKPTGQRLVLLNRLLLEDAFPQFIEKAKPNDDQLRQVTGRLDDAYFVLDPNKTDTLTRAVQAIDELFRQLDSRSANADIMGDIFEHLLGEIESSGKNGQFRTPRHIIRFMVQLLDPRPGTRILDPACGTGGFLVNTLLHWRAQTTDPDTLRLEWDGTPHRAFGDGSIERLPLDTCFTGYDNDRTMVRIGWMNLILHGLEFPRLEQRDSLSKRMPDGESDSYDFILANPPFTGQVDEDDLSEKLGRFPRAMKGGKKITTKSELLFVWLLLDLLKVGGRAAVVVPDGVLFGSTNAHRELRRQLLFENTLEGVVSLPAGVFLPYAGVKTSILVFQKAAEKVTPGADPRTREVWFYEVEDEAYSLDQKRKERFEGPNDLWDALEKFKAWREWQHAEYPKAFANKREAHRETASGGMYFQPGYFKERWRAVDREFLKVFPEHATQEGQVLSLSELFRAWEQQLQQEACRKLWHFLFDRLANSLRKTADELPPAAWRASAPKLIETTLREFSNQAGRLARDEGLLDREFDQFGWNALQQELAKWKADYTATPGSLFQRAEELAKADVRPWPEAQDQLREIVREFAKLDGYDVWRRDNKILCEKEGKQVTLPGGGFRREPVQLSWIIPVRAWAKLEAWGEDPKTKRQIKEPTHDAEGQARPDYLAWLRDTLKVFDTDGTVKEEFRDRLDPACIEAADFNLSASRHKPFTFEAGQHRPPAEVIRELDGIHGEIRSKLGKLLAMVEGKE